jgi:hypothetical protein
MLARSIPGLLALILFVSVVAAQDKKPADGKAKPKPFEATVAGRKVSFTPAEGWAEFKSAPVPDLPPNAAPWKLAGAWKSGKYEELTLRLFGVEKAGATATTVRDTWFEFVKSKGTPGIVVKADVSNPKDKALTGHDLEVDIKSGAEKVYYWVRTLNMGKDKVAVLFCEARPLKPPELNPFNHETFVREPHVLELQPMLASFLKPDAKPAEAWLRGPTFELSRGSASLKVDAPKGWEYTRLGPEGSVIWMAPGDSGREFIVAFEESDSAGRLQAEQMLIQAMGGKILQDREIQSPAVGHEIISTLKSEDRTLCNWRRLYQRGEVSVSVLAKVPVADVSATPADDVQKESKAFHESVRFGK